MAADEREINDIRATLNLGHTFGHAVETGMGYGVFLHGEAVSIGTVMAADLSLRMVGWLIGGTSCPCMSVHSGHRAFRRRRNGMEPYG